MSKVLLVGFDKGDGSRIKKIFRSVRVRCDQVDDPEAAYKRIPQNAPTLVLMHEPEQIADIRGMKAVLKKDAPTAAFLVVLDKNDINSATEYMRAGAYDCLPRPLMRVPVLAAAKRASRERGRSLILPKVKPEKRRTLQLISGLLGAVFSLVLVWKILMGPPVDTLNLDSNFLSGLQWDGRTLWIGDWFNSTVTKFHVQSGFTKKSRALATEALFRAKDTQPRLVCHTPDALITIGTDLKLRSHKWEVGLPVLQTVDLPGPNPTGLAWDGEHVWLSDGQTGLLYRMDKFFRVLGSKRSMISNPEGIAWYKNSLWVLGGKPLKIAQLQKMGLGFVWNGPYLLSDWIPEDKVTTGVGLAFDRVWMMFEGDPRVVSKSIRNIRQNRAVWDGKDKPEEKE